MGSKKKKVETTDNTADPFMVNMLNTASANARGFGEQAYTPYTGERVAGVSDMETNALSNYMGNNVSNRGFVEQGLTMAQQGAQYTPDQIQSQNFTDADISGYMNPYMENVIGNALSDIERREMASAENIDAQASKASAFGGSRQAIQQAESDRNFADIAAETGANLRSQGFQQAAAMYQQDAARQMQADLANQQAGMSGAELRMRGAGLLGDMAGRMSDADMREAAMRGSLGELERAQEQAELDAQYQSYLMAYDDPYRRAQIQLGLLGNTPMLQNNRATQTTSGGGLGSLLGGVGQVVGMFRGK